jgi:hypothetical protein
MDDPLQQPTRTPAERLQALAAWGVDLSLTRRMLELTPAERVAGTLETADRFAEGRTRHLVPSFLRRPRHPQPSRLLFQQLIAAEVDWVLVGRLAEIAQGAPLLADQVELCYRPDAANVARLLAALAPLRPRLQVGTRRERAPRCFARHGEHLLRDQATLALDTEAARLVLQQALPGVGAYPMIKQASVPLDLFGSRVLVLPLPLLLARRQARGLTEDELFVPQLEAAWLLAATESAPATPASVQ